MTIIVYKDNILASDRAEYMYGIVTGTRQKFCKHVDGGMTYYIAVSGDTTTAAIVCDLIKFFAGSRFDDYTPHQFKLKDVEQEMWVNRLYNADTFSGILIIVNEHINIPAVFNLSNAPYALPVTSDEYAVGSEDAVIAARAAMMAGATAREAVKIACELTNIAQIKGNADIDSVCVI